MGVISLGEVPARLRIGPVPTTFMIADPAYLVGNMTRDVMPDLPDIKIVLLQSLYRSHLEEWVPYLRAARHPGEQNLEMHRLDSVFGRAGEIYFETTRSVRPGEELLVWFSPTYSLKLGAVASDIEAAFHGSSEGFQCSDCNLKCQYGYVLIAHKLFKCCFNKSVIKFDTDISECNFKENINHKDPEDYPGSPKLQNCPSSFSYFPPYQSPQNVCAPPLWSLDKLTAAAAAATRSWYETSGAEMEQHQLDRVSAKPVGGSGETARRTSNPMVDNLMRSALQAVTTAAIAAPSSSSSSSSAASSCPEELPGYPSRLIHGVPLNIAQNWCAKCRTTFRMTSDLVYHMRTHHKGSTETTSGPARSSLDAGCKKRGDPTMAKLRGSRTDNKLHCTVCGESFRERHHLTRHMISHD